MSVGAADSVLASERGRYKYQRLRERLRAAIVNGELKSKLPGERELARRYGANAKTINKALCDLATEGLLVRQVGRGTFVAGDRTNGRSATARTFGCIVSNGLDRALTERICTAVEQMVIRQGHRLEKTVLSAAAAGTSSVPTSRIRGWSGAAAIAARPPLDVIGELHRRHLPLVIINNCDDRVKTFTVLPDYAQGTFELCRQFIQLGHKRIQLIVSSHLLPAAMTAEAGYRAALQRYGLTGRDAVRGEAPFRWSDLGFGSDAPTAIIAIGAAAGKDARHHHGADVSVSCLAEPGDTTPQDESLTAYETPIQAMLEWAAELLLSTGPGDLPRAVIVPGQLVERASTRALA